MRSLAGGGYSSRQRHPRAHVCHFVSYYWWPPSLGKMSRQGHCKIRAVTSWNAGLTVVEARGVQSETERRLDTGSESLGVAEAEDTGVVDLGLDERGVVLVGSALTLAVSSSKQRTQNVEPSQCSTVRIMGAGSALPSLSHVAT